MKIGYEAVIQKLCLGIFIKLHFYSFFLKTSKNKAILFNYAIILKQEKCYGT